MPIYAYKCHRCGTEKEEFFPLAQSGRVVICECGTPMKKDFSKWGGAYHDVPVDSVDWDLTGDPITYHTRGQLKEIAKQHGCTVTFGTNRNHGEREDCYKGVRK